MFVWQFVRIQLHIINNPFWFSGRNIRFISFTTICRLRNISSKVRVTKVVSFRSKPQFMSQMSTTSIQSPGICSARFRVLFQYFCFCSLFCGFEWSDFLFRKACKVAYKYLEDGTKVRVSRGMGASGSIIPRPEILKIRTTPRPTVGTHPKTPFRFFFSTH